MESDTPAPAVPEPVRTGRPSRAFAWLVVTLGWLVVPALCVAAFAAWKGLPGISTLPTSGVQALLPEETSAGKAELDSVQTIQKEYWRIFWQQPEVADSIVTPAQKALFPMLRDMAATPMRDREHSQWQFGHPVTFSDKAKPAPVGPASVNKTQP